MKKENNNKYLTIRIPDSLIEKFQQTCVENYKTMSEALRDMIQVYVKENKDKWVCIPTNIDWTQHQYKKSCLTSTSVV